jgi:hypothetical protein
MVSGTCAVAPSLAMLSARLVFSDSLLALAFAPLLQLVVSNRASAAVKNKAIFFLNQFL